jgi:hypothetical protein
MVNGAVWKRCLVMGGCGRAEGEGEGVKDMQDTAVLLKLDRNKMKKGIVEDTRLKRRLLRTAPQDKLSSFTIPSDNFQIPASYLDLIALDFVFHQILMFIQRLFSSIIRECRKTSELP